ncbi:serine protease [Rhodobacteraceae bacterium 63075]|nr:serine protease [Rhodobacteraceae bacterium 63075]
MLACLTCLPMTHSAQAQNFAALFERFNPAALSHDDKRFLQAALAFEGHYKGLLDGDWGKLSNLAMNRYAASEFGSTTESWHMAFLAFSFLDEIDRNGWTMDYSEWLDMSFLVPKGSLAVDKSSEDFVNFRHLGSSLSYSIGLLDEKTAQNIHDYTQESHARSSKPYSVRKNNLAVSTARMADGKFLYTRSNYRKGRWSTIMLSANQIDKATLDAVASSIGTGYVAPITLSQNGLLRKVITDTITVLAEESDENEKAAQPQTVAPVPKEETTPSAGTGFIVSAAGHVLTNDHVVTGCSSYTIDGAPADLVAQSPEFDLALLQSARAQEKTVAVFSAAPPRLNSDVTVVGFPYGGALSGLNVTRGAVSSLKGLGGDATRLQITAPVQSGNSGGPLVGPDGEVVGVVVSKIDVLEFAETMGDVPQNVNFAIRGEIAKMFLSQQDVHPKLSLEDTMLDPTEIAERASAFTVFVECQ